MTVMTERASQMAVEDFETLAEVAENFTVPVRLEFINGRIGAKGMTDGDHSEIVRWLHERCMQFRPDLGVYADGLGLEVETYRQGRARPDLVLAPRRSFAGQGEWGDPQPVLMAVEVTSYDSDTNRRDRREKPAAYAEAGIPVYLLVDRQAGIVTAHFSPSPIGYRGTHMAKFGDRLAIPEPVGFELNTEELKDFVR
jgi:Uma2 family endonuclease